MRVGPKFKICRRLGDSVFSKCQTTRYALTEGKKKSIAMKKRKHRSNTTEFGIQLLEKQKLRFTYGISERQLANYILKSKKISTEAPAANVYKLLESRLDNVVYRMGFVQTRQFARQVVGHGHITVNGKKVDVPSYSVRLGDKIAIRTKSKDNVIFKNKSEGLKEFNTVPAWISLDKTILEASISGAPKVGEFETNLNFGLVVQFYSRV